MITSVIVVASIALTLGFLLAWMASPRLRAWIERPKHRFHDAARGYDREQQQEAAKEHGEGRRD